MKIDFRLVQVQTTSACNAKCLCCPHRTSWFQTKSGTGYMSDALYKKIIDDIADVDDFDGKFCPYLANEPFVDNKILERTQYAMEKLPKALIEFSSNMELLTPDKIDELFEICKNHMFRCVFRVSHHGVDKSTFEEMMSINYETSLENLIYLVRKFNGLMPIGIQNMVISKDFKKKLSYTLRDVQEYWTAIWIKNKLPYKNVQFFNGLFHNRAGNVKMDGWDYERIVRKIDKDHPFSCFRFDENTLHVLFNGEVTLCCMSPYSHEAIFGDLSKQTIEEIWNSKERQHLLNQCRGIEDSPEDFICKRCMSPGG